MAGEKFRKYKNLEQSKSLVGPKKINRSRLSKRRS